MTEIRAARVRSTRSFHDEHLLVRTDLDDDGHGQAAHAVAVANLEMTCDVRVGTREYAHNPAARTACEREAFRVLQPVARDGACGVEAPRMRRYDRHPSLASPPGSRAKLRT